MAAFLLGVPGKLKTLLDRLTADRASRLDEVTATRMGRLDTNVASRATQASVNTALTDLATLQERLTAARGSNLDYLDAPISGVGGSVIKSVQRGNVLIYGSSGVVTTTAAVVMDKSILIFSFLSNDRVTGRITSTTQIAFERLSTVGSMTIEWQVIEYE